MTEPITPREAEGLRVSLIPDEVIDVFNSLIAREFDGRRAVVLQKDAARLIASRMECTQEHAYAMRWLDVEPIFRAAGWEVTHDQPAYCESFEATFTFTKRR